jgi:perosamine synthetase
MTVINVPSTRPAIAGGKPAKTKPFNKERRYGDEEVQELHEAIAQGTLFYAQGKKVKQFEAAFAQHHGLRHGIATTSGTAAIHTAFMATGISPGDEVIVPPITDMGSIVPILFQGAVPVFADLDPHTYNLDPKSVEAAITPKTRAILAVHLAGNACDLTALKSIADRHNLLLIEDCAQAHGTLYNGKAVGTVGQIGCYSYNEFKHISCGDGGIVLTDDDKLAVKCRLATDKCYNRSPDALSRQATFLAANYRMTELQGAVAIAQLKKLPSIVDRRRKWCGALLDRLADLEGIDLPTITPGCSPSWWFFLFRVRPDDLGGADADHLAAALKAEGLPVAAHYIGDPIYTYPLFQNHTAFDHAPHPFANRQYQRGHCPTAEAILKTSVILSVNEAYDQQDLDETVDAFHKVVNHFRAKRA